MRMLARVAGYGLVLCASCVPNCRTEWMFSEVKGQVTFRGEPLQNATVYRYYNRSTEEYPEHEKVDKATTNKEGRFEFGEATQEVYFSVVGQWSTSQRIVIEWNKREYLGWETVKWSPEENSELGRSIELDCELSNEPRTWRMRNRMRFYEGLCRAEGAELKEP